MKCVGAVRGSSLCVRVGVGPVGVCSGGGGGVSEVGG